MKTRGHHLAGAVLAGGDSRRMGTDKSLLCVAGELMWRRQLRVLDAAGAQPVVVVRRSAQSDLSAGVTHVRDTFDGAGPLAGLHAALAASRAPWLAVLAVDMPAIDAAWFDALASHCGSGRGAVARHGKGFEPLAAIYPQTALSVAEAQLRSGNYSLQRLAAMLLAAGEMSAVELPDSERWRVTNTNTPAEFGALRSRPIR